MDVINQFGLGHRIMRWNHSCVLIQSDRCSNGHVYTAGPELRCQFVKCFLSLGHITDSLYIKQSLVVMDSLLLEATTKECQRVRPGTYYKIYYEYDQQYQTGLGIHFHDKSLTPEYSGESATEIIRQ